MHPEFSNFSTHKNLVKKVCENIVDNFFPVQLKWVSRLHQAILMQNEAKNGIYSEVPNKRVLA